MNRYLSAALGLVFGVITVGAQAQERNRDNGGQRGERSEQRNEAREARRQQQQAGFPTTVTQDNAPQVVQDAGRVNRGESPGRDSDYRGDQGRRGDHNRSRGEHENDNRYSDDHNGGENWEKHGDNRGRYGYDGRGRDNNHRGRHDNRGWGNNHQRWSQRGWNRNEWRRDWSHGWSGSRHRAPVRYYYPRGYTARSWSVGVRLPPVFYTASYYVNYGNYGLAPPPYGCQWVRIDGDIMLVDLATGEVLDVLNNFYY